MARDSNLLRKLLVYSDRYEISIQFWPDQTAVFIEKDGIDLENFGSSDQNEAIKMALEYLNRINKKF